jgi:peptidoglycan DL-endopeptidase CwlO
MISVRYRKSSKYLQPFSRDKDENMTTKTTKAATIGILVATLAIMLAYSALVIPASAQSPGSTTSTTSSSSTSSSASATTTMSAPPQIRTGGQGWPGGPGWGMPQGGTIRGGGPMGGPFGAQSQANLTVGQTITITSTAGQYVTVSNNDQNGTASGTLTFSVTGKLSEGYTLSITSGSIVVNGTTYTVSSGSAQMDRSASQLNGQGATSSSGSFLVSATAHGNFAGSTATVSLDLTNGSTEYLVFLTGTVQG